MNEIETSTNFAKKINLNLLHEFNDLTTYLTKILKLTIQHKSMLNLVISNLMLSQEQGYSWIVYSRDPKRYSDIDHIEFKKLTEIISALEDQYFIKHMKGFYDKQFPEKSTRSKFLGRLKFYNLANQFGFIKDTFCPYYFEQKPINDSNCIIFKDEDKNILDMGIFKRTTKLENLLNEMKTINKFYQSINVKMKNYPIEYNGISFQRIFSKASMDTWKQMTSNYGRIHGVHQMIKGKFRKNILINDKETVEIDIKCCSTSIFYSMLNLQFPDDSYNVFSEDDYLTLAQYSKSDLRKIVKTIITIATNAKANTIGHKNSIIKEARKKYGVHIYEMSDLIFIMDKVFEYHKPIMQFFYNKDKCSGLIAMKYESDIILRVMKRFMAKKIHILPIHDSIIVAKEHADLLEKTLIREWQRTFRTTPRLEREC